MSECFSGVIDQQFGQAYEHIRIVAENIESLLLLANAQETINNTHILNLLQGSSKVVSVSELVVDENNSLFNASPEAGNSDDILTINGGENGRVILIQPANPNYSLTFKPMTTREIANIDSSTNELVSPGHGLTLGQQVRVPSNIAGLELHGPFYVIPTTADKFKLATSKALAQAGAEIDLYQDAAGILEVGNLIMNEELVISGYDTITFIKDGPHYKIWASVALSSTLQATLDQITSSIADIEENKQNVGALLAALTALNTSGKANYILTVNDTGDGFKLVAPGVPNHTHAIDDITGLINALAGKASTGHNHDAAYAAAGHDHDNRYQLKPTISSSPPSGGVNGDVWFMV